MTEEQQTYRQKMTDYRSKRRAAARVLRDRYRGEYERLLAAQRKLKPDPKDYGNCTEATYTQLIKAHREEYLKLVPHKPVKSKWVLNEHGELVQTHDA